MSRNAIWRRPRADRARGSRPCRRARRTARATGRAPSRSRPRTSPAGACRRGTPSGSPSARGRVDQARGEERVDHRVDVDQAEAERHRHHQHERLLDRRVAPVEHDAAAAPRRARARAATASAGTPGSTSRSGSRPRRRRASCSIVCACGTPITRPAMIARFQNDRRERRHGEVVVAVEDPDDDPGDAEQRDDREQHAREPDRERAVVARIAEDADHPRRDEHEERGQRASARAASARRGSRRPARRASARPSRAAR